VRSASGRGVGVRVPGLHARQPLAPSVTAIASIVLRTIVMVLSPRSGDGEKSPRFYHYER
jgi:hypothetical protein